MAAEVARGVVEGFLPLPATGFAAVILLRECATGIALHLNLSDRRES
jgi:hypothetical protein